MGSNDLNAVKQGELLLARKPHAVSISDELIAKQPNLSNAIALCVQASGLEDKELYIPLEIDCGHWSHLMKGKHNFPPNKFNDLMDLCGNEAPLQWLARSRGYGLVLLKSEAERRAEEAEQELAKANEKVALLTDLLRSLK